MGLKLTLVLIWVVTILVAIVGTTAVYYEIEYPVDRANGYVDLAAASNNMTQTLSDLNATLSILAPYHGNPNPIFPTAHTNFDLIKQQIESTIQSGEKVLNATPDSFAYQQALKNIQSDLTTTVEGEIKDAGSALGFWYGDNGILLILECTALPAVLSVARLLVE